MGEGGLGEGRAGMRKECTNWKGRREEWKGGFVILGVGT